MPPVAGCSGPSARAVAGGLLLLCLAGLGGTARADDAADEVFFRRASACAAVLKRDVLAMKARFQGGDQQLRAQMLQLTEQSFAFVGTAYKRGLRSPRADQLLDEAEAAQQRQAPAALRRLSSECQAEGGRLMTEANVIERALVRNRARARLQHWLAPPAS